ncbi:MAG: DUF3800 domain-containing protein [Rickettsiales bacterium]
MLIFLDESGDLGFDLSKQGASRKFVITILICHTTEIHQLFQKAVKRTLRHKINPKSKRKRIVHELKGSSTTIQVKEYFFRQLPKTGWEVHSIILNKSRVFDHLRTKQGKKKLYNFLARKLLENISLQNGGNAVNLIVDRCKNTEEIKDFNSYITNQLEALLPLETDLYITHENSQSSAGLQAVDMFCWGIGKKHNNPSEKGREWYMLFNSKIIQEIDYL